MQKYVLIFQTKPLTFWTFPRRSWMGNMMMIVNMEDATNSFAEISEELEKMGDEIHCIIRVQREEIFNKMHRI